MSMELDIEVCLDAVPVETVLELQKKFPVTCACDNANAIARNAIISAWDHPRAVVSVDEEVSRFLQQLDYHAETVRGARGVIRLGIFYALTETVVFPFRLSVETVKEIGALNLAMDVTGYPCSEESEEDDI